MSGETDLIMGHWSNLSFAELEPFLASLRHSGFPGEVRIFVSHVTPETVRNLQVHGVRVERPGQSAQPRMTHLSSRFFTYLDFLARHGANYRRVMLTDLRDVVFQADPFAVAWPADIVFAHERCRLADCPVNRAWVIQGYGDAVAENMRNCVISCAGTTFGTVGGLLRYLAAMTSELTSRPVAIEGGIDQGVHNYIVHMRPPADAWLDTGDAIVATMHYVPVDAVTMTPRGALIDGNLVPVLHQWQKHAAIAGYVRSDARFRLPPPASRAAVTDGAGTVVAYYHRERDAGWLEVFLCSLRGTGFSGALHCIGEFDADAIALLARYGAVPQQVGPLDPSMQIENVAHLLISQVLDRITGDDLRDQVLVLDNARAGFLRDPFQNCTVGVSVFCEGPMQIGESEYNLHRLAMFTEGPQRFARLPIISSMSFRGRMDHVRALYRKLFIEFVGRAELLRIAKSIQGAVNKLCHGGGFEFPIVMHPNAAEILFDFWPGGMPVVTRPDIRVGNAVPAIVLGDSLESEVMAALRRGLGLAQAARQAAKPTD
jgi:hypothetical protein